MREHIYKKHGSARACVRAVLREDANIRGVKVEELSIPPHPSSKDRTPRTFKSMVKKAKEDGLFAFTHIPRNDDMPSTIHFWHEPTLDSERIALMLGHELGHISGGGPNFEISPAEEEQRADAYGYVARETVVVLRLYGILSPDLGAPNLTARKSPSVAGPQDAPPVRRHHSRSGLCSSDRSARWRVTHTPRSHRKLRGL